MTLPPDIASDCVDIVMELANIARSNPSAKVIALTQEGITEILDIEDRIQKYTAHDAIMINQKAGE